MANALYNAARDAFARGAIDWVNDDIRAILVATSLYTFNQTHDFLNDVPSGARLATVSLVGRTVANGGFCDAADPTAPSVAAGSTLGAIIVYKHTGTESTSPLIAYIDTGTNLPVVTNGGDITITWSTNGVFRL